MSSHDWYTPLAEERLDKRHLKWYTLNNAPDPLVYEMITRVLAAGCTQPLNNENLRHLGLILYSEILEYTMREKNENT